MIFDVYQQISAFGGTVKNVSALRCMIMLTGLTRLNGVLGPLSGDLSLVDADAGTIEYINYDEQEECGVNEVQVLFECGDGACPCQITEWIPFHPEPAGCSNFTTLIPNATQFSSANRFIDASPHSGSHFHTFPGGGPPPSLPINAVEVSGFFGDEVARGMMEFDLSTVEALNITHAMLTFDLYDTSGITGNQFGSPFAAFGDEPFVGEIEIYAYDTATLAPDLARYSDPATLVSTFHYDSSDTLATVYSLPILVGVIKEKSSIGFRFQMQTEDDDATGITFENGMLEVGTDTCCILIEERDCETWDCPMICADGVDWCLQTPTIFVSFSDNLFFGGNPPVAVALNELNTTQQLSFAADCQLGFSTTASNGWKVALNWRWEIPGPSVQLLVWDNNGELKLSVDLVGACDPTPDPDFLCDTDTFSLTQAGGGPSHPERDDVDGMLNPDEGEVLQVMYGPGGPITGSNDC